MPRRPLFRPTGSNPKLSAHGDDMMARAVGYGIESLEPRVLFHTIGYDSTTNTIIPDGQFEYYDEKKNTVRVVWHDVIAELIGASVDPMTDQVRQSDLIQPSTPAPLNGVNLFTIYITHSTLDSYISIAEVPAITATGARNMEPFTGSIGAISIINPGPGDPRVNFTIPGGTGDVLLGGLFFGPKGSPFAANQAFETLSTTIGTDAMGVYPGSPTGTLTAGVQETPVQMDPATGFPITDATTGLETPNDLGRFFFGGTILGAINIPAPTPGTIPAAPASQGGNVGVFYAGCILTGDPSGIISGAGSIPNSDGNFVIAGDIRDLITNGPIGGGPVGNNSFLTGTHIVVDGTIGEINLHQSDFYASYDAVHSPAVYGLPENLFAETELEFKGPNAGVIFQGNAFGGAVVQYPALSILTNDTPATPQYLGSEKEADPISGLPITDASGRITYGAFVSGTIQGGIAPADRETGSDYYAVALMAGQTITVTPNTLDEAQTQIIDPDGRIVASDNGVRQGTVDAPFQYTADRPGVYAIGVLDLPNLIELEDIPYTLDVEGIGDMGAAAVATQGGDIFDGGFDTAFEVDNGDLGAMVASARVRSLASGTTFQSTGTTLIPGRTLLVADGDLRALSASTLGRFLTAPGSDGSGGIFGEGPTIDVPSGSVGLLQATDTATATGILDVTTRFVPNLLTSPVVNSPTPFSAIGGDIQRINGAATTFIQVAADGGIGTIDAGNMATGLAPTGASFIEVNADNKGSDGIIDMVDCQGAMGTLAAGGPGFVTNEGGDIRYMRVGGPVFKDAFFGSTQLLPLQFAAGQVAVVTDDSGATATFTPVGAVATTTILNADGTTTTTTVGPQISIQSYPVRDKGGQVILSVVSTGSLTVAGSGLSGGGSAVEVGSIEFQGQGRALVVGPNDPRNNTTLTQPLPVVATGTTDLSDMELNINGNIRVDVLNVITTVTVAGNEAVAINNNTPGELVGVTGPGAATIFSAGNLGLATPRATSTAVLPKEALLTAYPFSQTTTGVNVSGSVITMSANGAIGNINVGGDLQTLIANASGKSVPGVYAGIDGAVVVGGRLLNVRDGQGILPTGTADVGQAGIFAAGKIGTVTAGGTIRGDIISLQGDAVTQVGIDAINVGGSASIIGSVIGVITAFNQVDPTKNQIVIPNFAEPAGVILNDIGLISVSGTGGIIGTQIFGFNIGPVTVGSKGFGVFDSSLKSVGNGTIAGINAGGYGIRDVLVSGGINVGSLSASGTGAELSVLKFSKELLVSNTPNEFDPFFGTLPNPNTDLNAALGTSLVSPIVAGVTDTGVIEDTIAQGTGTLGGVFAHSIRTALPSFNIGVPGEVAPSLNIPVIGTTFNMALSFGAGIGSVGTSGPIDGLQITTGSLGGFHPSAGVSRLGISVAGLIKSITIHGNLGQTVTDPVTGLLIPDSYVNATGPDGNIASLTVTGNLNAQVNANAAIGSMNIGGNEIGAVTVLGHTNGLALKSLRIGGALQNGSLSINGNAGSISTVGGLGATGDSLTIFGNLGSLTVGTAHRPGLNLNAAVHIEGTLGKLTTFGGINAPLLVDSDVSSMKITAFQPGNLINAPITIGGRLKTAMITNGNIAANIIVNGSINTFTLSHGSVQPGAIIQSTIEAIHSFKITGGATFGLFGALLASNGLNEKIDISGSIGNGINAGTILALSGSTFHIRGNISATGTITVNGPLDSLLVDGNIAAGGVVIAHPLKKLKVRGTNQGTITAV